MPTNSPVAPAVFAAGFTVAVLFLAAAHAQVLAPEEIRDPGLRVLQEKYRNELKLIPQILAAHEFPYKFYFSRRLDVAEKDQPRNDQRSVQFDWYKGKVVLKITGNYFVSYSAELMTPEQRARETYQEVMLPLLRAAVRALEHADAPQAFAFEISHHVRRKVLGISSEAAENVVLILPKAAAERMLTAADPKAQEEALVEAEVFLNAAPVSLWRGTGDSKTPGDAGHPGAAGDLVAGDSKASPPTASPSPTVSPRLLQGISIPGLANKLPEPFLPARVFSHGFSEA